MTTTTTTTMPDTDVDRTSRSGTGRSLELHRNGRIAAVVGLAASATAIAWLGRAGGGGSWLDWVVCGVTALIGVNQLLALADARTPLLAADEHGVRIRLAREWLGLPWSTLEQVVVEEREGPVRNGRLVLVPRHLDEVLEAVLPSSRRSVAWQRRLHGAPLSVPLSVATRTSGGDVVATLRRLAEGRTEVVAVRGRDRAALAATPPTGQPTQAAQAGAPHAGVRSARAGAGPVLARLLARLAGEPVQDDDRRDPEPTEATPVAPVAAVAPAPVPEPPRRAVAPVAAVREAREAVRAEIVRAARSRTVAAEPPEAAELARVAHVEERARGAVVIGDDEPTSPPDPVIGPQVREARLRARLDVEELSDRTRIRPHVLEAIEVDDFGPCGGDFYARGHLRTLARYLGLDAEALVGAYDERYSHAPVNARRVFEAELATGISGGMRATSGGPRWSLIAAAVLALMMVWGVARFLTDAPAPLGDPVVSDSAGLAANHEPITSPLTDTRPVQVKAIGARTRVVVRDRTGTVLWSGVLHPGESRSMAGVAPLTVRGSNAAATRIKLGTHWVGPVGSGAGAGTRHVG